MCNRWGKYVGKETFMIIHLLFAFTKRPIPPQPPPTPVSNLIYHKLKIYIL